MQWVKQTFAAHFNRSAERTGHVWGDRYWSRVLEGEPPEGVGEVDWEVVAVAAKTGVISFGPWPPDGVSPLMGKPRRKRDFRPKTLPIPLPRPAKPPNPAPIRAESPTKPPRATLSNNSPGRGLPKTVRHHQKALLSVEFQGTAPCITTVQFAQQTSGDPHYTALAPAGRALKLRSVPQVRNAPSGTGTR
jgi:hypothetical protein